MTKWLAVASIAFAASPLSAEEPAAPDRQVAGLNAPVFSELLRQQRVSGNLSKPGDAGALIAAVMQDGKVDAAERDLLIELTQPVFQSIAIGREGAAQGEPKLYLYPARVEGRRMLFVALDPELETAWAEPHHGWPKLLARADAGPAGKAHIAAYLEAKLGEKWGESNIANRYQPLRTLIGELYTGSALAPGVDTAAARAMLHGAMKGIDAGADDRIPDFLYNWVVAPPAAPAS